MSIKGNCVNLGIDAPKDISVHRTEAVCKLKKPSKDE
jgi:carbon storage regulator CsrA